MTINKANVTKQVKKWQPILRLQDWDIETLIVKGKWRKSGDIKIDLDNKIAVLMVNERPKCENLEEVVIHELLHLKLWTMDQMIEEMINALYGAKPNKKRDIVYGHFMSALESTVQDLTKGFLTASGSKKPLSLGRLRVEIAKEINGGKQAQLN